MATFKLGICEPNNFSTVALDLLKRYFEVHCFQGDDLKGFIEDKNILFVRLGYKYDDELLGKANDLKYICSPTTGLNHISLSGEKVSVISLQGEQSFLASIRATPEHVFGLTIALLRNYSHAFLSQENSRFDREPYKGKELYNNNIGIIGMGRIGRLLSKYFKAFDANVFFCDVIDIFDSEYGIRCRDINELIDRTNVIILEANYTKENSKMITKEHFVKMKNKYFINAARGELVDEETLISLMQSGWFAGVALDVLDNENSDARNLYRLLELRKNSNVIITPHIGGATYSSMQRTEEFIAKKLINKMKDRGELYDV